MPIITKEFNELDIVELYEILKLRAAVFVVEQNCAYLDLDDVDIFSHHDILLDENFNIHAYCRIVPPNLKYKGYASIGRVLSSSESRGKGYGRKIVSHAIQQIKELYPNYNIKISAQLYLQEFYESLDFEKITDTYMEDNIPHIGMKYVFKN